MSNLVAQRQLFTRVQVDGTAKKKKNPSLWNRQFVLGLWTVLLPR